MSKPGLAFSNVILSRRFRPYVVPVGFPNPLGTQRRVGALACLDLSGECQMTWIALASLALAASLGFTVIAFALVQHWD